MNLIKGFNISIVIAVIATAIIFGGGVYFWQQRVNQSESQNTSVANENDTSSTELANLINQNRTLQSEVTGLKAQIEWYKAQKIYVSDQPGTSGKKKFSNDTIGISFEYPEQLGNVELTIRPGETGNIFLGIFTGNDKISFGGIDADFSEGRDGGFLDTQGYLYENGTYYFKFVSAKPIVDDVYKLEPLEIMSVGGHKILLLDENSFVSARGSDGPAIQIGSNNYGALINLPGEQFHGLAIWDNDTSALPLNDFKELIRSIKFL